MYKQVKNEGRYPFSQFPDFRFSYLMSLPLTTYPLATLFHYVLSYEKHTR